MKIYKTRTIKDKTTIAHLLQNFQHFAHQGVRLAVHEVEVFGALQLDLGQHPHRIVPHRLQVFTHVLVHLIVIKKLLFRCFTKSKFFTLKLLNWAIKIKF